MEFGQWIDMERVQAKPKTQLLGVVRERESATGQNRAVFSATLFSAHMCVFSAHVHPHSAANTAALHAPCLRCIKHPCWCGQFLPV